MGTAISTLRQCPGPATITDTNTTATRVTNTKITDRSRPKVHTRTTGSDEARRAHGTTQVLNQTNRYRECPRFSTLFPRRGEVPARCLTFPGRPSSAESKSRPLLPGCQTPIAGKPARLAGLDPCGTGRTAGVSKDTPSHGTELALARSHSTVRPSGCGVQQALFRHKPRRFWLLH